MKIGSLRALEHAAFPYYSSILHAIKRVSETLKNNGLFTVFMSREQECTKEHEAILMFCFSLSVC